MSQAEFASRQHGDDRPMPDFVRLPSVMKITGFGRSTIHRPIEQ
jgi:predicted DNA-binding transcriptional regulator AlpA